VTQHIINKLAENSILESSPNVTHDGVVRQNWLLFSLFSVVFSFLIFRELHIFPWSNWQVLNIL